MYIYIYTYTYICVWGHAFATPLLSPPQPSDAARARLSVVLERALAHTPSSVPLPHGAWRGLLAACSGAEDAPAPVCLLRSLCVAANKWATEEELATALAEAQPAAAGGSVGALLKWCVFPQTL